MKDIYQEYLKQQNYSKRMFEEFEHMLEEYRECLQHLFYWGCDDGSFILYEIQRFFEYKPEEQYKTKRKLISNKIKKQVFERDKYRCLKCGTHKDLSIDHIIPIIKDGDNNVENLQTLCVSCNSSKGAKDNVEFMEK